MSELEQDILEIIKDHVGDENKITQYRIADKILGIGRELSCRSIRSVIEELIKQGYPIVSTPKNGGGYHWQKTNQEGLDCAKRIRRQAIKLFVKARKIRANSRMGQLNLDIRF